MVYVVEDKKYLHFVDVNTGNIANTVELKEKKHRLKVLNNGSSVAITQKKKCILYDGKTGQEIRTQEFNEDIKDVYTNDKGQYLVLAKKSIAQIDPSNGEILSELELDADFTQFYDVDNTLFIGGRGSSLCNDI